MKKRTVKSIRGVEVHRAKTGATTIFIRYMAARKPYHERIGPSELDDKGRDITLAKARATLKMRRAEIREARLRKERWLTPDERAELAKKAEEEARAGRSALLYENVAARFIAAFGERYVDPKAQRREDLRGPLPG